ncbi:MAG: TIGR03663 family protein [Acidobacteriota bacterium]|nr:TIGR03663 family protein [Acidobacteriota bacterium]
MMFGPGLVRRCAPWLILLVVSLGLHFWDLDERSFHHDESIHAHASYLLLENGTYQYDPTYHGPLLYYLTATTFALAGDSDFTARLPIALAGVLIIAVAWASRRILGVRPAWWTALLATISPIWLYYGRFIRMDLLEVLVASCAFVALWRAVHGSRRAWAWIGVWTGLAFATKENAFVTAALVGAVAGLLLLSQGVPRAWRLTSDWIVRYRWGILASIAAAVVVTVPLFTFGFRHNGDWFFPYKAISYWWGQHSLERVAGPPWYHLPRLALYEFFPIAAGLVWAVRRGRRMGVLERSLVAFAIASVAMYAYLGEKVPWLGVHQVWAFLPLAGFQLARTFGPHGVWWSRALAGIGLAAMLVTTVVANFVLDEITPNRDRVEALIYVQTCPELLPPVAEAYGLAAAGEDPVSAVGGEVAWPYTWYFRDTPTWWADPTRGMRPPLVFCDPENEREVRRVLGPGYISEKLPLRGWWVMEDLEPTFGDVVRYIFTRRPWGVIGTTNTVVLRDTGEAVDGARDAPVPGPLADALGIESASIIGEGWLMEPRGLAVAPDGVLAVADAAAGEVSFYSPDGTVLEHPISEAMNQPESLAWTPDAVLVVADTWNHRVLVFSPASGAARPLPEPEGGWYGPRSVAVAPDGTVAVSDTGHKQVALISFSGGAPTIATFGREGSAPGEFVEPVGLTWLDNRRLLICDTGNKRLQVVDRAGRSLEIVALPDAWSDFYSRPQVVALDDDRWLVTDVPAQSLWLVDGDSVRKLDLAMDGITPSGLAVGDGTLFVADLDGRVWAMRLPTRP